MVSASRGDDPLLFAAARADVTPPAGLPLAGYVLRGDGVATDAHDPLEAILVALRDPRAGGGRVTWAVLDAVEVDAELAARIAQAVAEASGGRADDVVVAATHTHSGPAGWVRGIHPAVADAADERMREALVARIAAAAADLPAAERPVRVLVAEGDAGGVGSNRESRGGPHDDTVGVLAFVGPGGAIAGAVLDYASHATVLGHANLAWSADWPGAARRALAALLAGTHPFPVDPAAPAGAAEDDAPFPAGPAGGAPVVAFLQGAAGDASARFTRRAQTFAEVDRLGALLGASAARALLLGAPGAAAPALVVRRRSVTVPTRRVPPFEEARRRAVEAEAAWREVERREGPGPLERIARTRYEGAQLQLDMAGREIPGAMDLPLVAVALGDAAWIHLPVELFASFGLAIRAASPFRLTRVVGYAGGYAGYVADAEAHEAGMYEAAASLFDAAGGDILVQAAIELLGEARAGIDGAGVRASARDANEAADANGADAR